MCRMMGITNYSYEVHKTFLEGFLSWQPLERYRQKISQAILTAGVLDTTRTE